MLNIPIAPQKTIDLIYIEGTGDIVEALTRWHNKEDMLTETSRTFSGQVFDFCRTNKLNILAISSFNQEKSVCFDGFSAYSQKKTMWSSGIRYHLSQILYGLKLVAITIRYRPKYLHVTNGTAYLFMLAPLKLFGVKIFPHFHTALWAKGFPPTRTSHKLLLSLDAWFLTHIATSVMCEWVGNLLPTRQCESAGKF